MLIRKTFYSLSLIYFIVGMVNVSRGVAANELVTLQLSLGLNDEEPTRWNGRFVLENGSIVRLTSIRECKWKKPLSWTGKSVRQNIKPVDYSGPEDKFFVLPMMFVTVLDVLPGSTVGVKTGHGEFTIDLAALPQGAAQTFLEGSVKVERIIPARQITKSETEDDFPSACMTSNGTIWIAYTSYTNGIPREEWLGRVIDKELSDFSFLAKEPGGDQIRVITLRDGYPSESMPITSGGEDLYGTAMGVDSKDRPWVVWSANNKEGIWDLFASCHEKDKWKPPIRLTRNTGADIHPVIAARRDGLLWLAWQGFRGNNSDIFVMSLNGDKWSKEIVVSNTPANEWLPAIAVSRKGEVCVAWDTYNKGDYDIYYATISGSGKVSEPHPVAATLKFEAVPSVLYDLEDRLWIAWEEGNERWGKDWGTTDRDYGAPLYRKRKIGVRCFENGKPYQSSSSLIEIFRTPGNRKNNNATLGMDGFGRIWLLFRHHDGPRRNSSIWNNYASCFNGKAWSRPAFIESSDGLMCKRPVLVRGNDGILRAVYNSDARKRSPLNLNNNIWIAQLKANSEKTPALLEPEEPVQIAEPEPATIAEVKDVARCRAYSSVVNGKEYHLFRGDFHRHTEISGDGGRDGSILDMWRYGLDVAALDWIANTDHENGGRLEYTWWITQKLSDVFLVGNTFIPMFGYERSVPYPNGHRNIMFSQRGVRTLPLLKNLFSLRDTKMLYRYLYQFNGLCSSHTTATDMGTNWRNHNPALEPVIEVFQGLRHSYEYEGAPRSGDKEEKSKAGWRPDGYWWNALAKGYLLGVQCGSDHISTHIAYTFLYIEESATREKILNALKKRHCYGATDNIILDVRIGKHMMGDVLKSIKPARLDIKAIGTDVISQVDIIKDNQIVYTKKPNQQEVSFSWTDPAVKPPGRSYYYVRVMQKNGELAWGSPIWIDYEQ